MYIYKAGPRVGMPGPFRYTDLTIYLLCGFGSSK